MEKNSSEPNHSFHYKEFPHSSLVLSLSHTHTGVSSGRSVITKPRLHQSYPNEPVASVFSLHKDTQAHAAETSRAAAGINTSFF